MDIYGSNIIDGKRVIYVHNASLLASAVSRIRNEKVIFADTEFDRNRHHYGFHLCVVQIAAGNDVYIIDAIETAPSKSEIAPALKDLFDIFSSEEILKVFHACSEDIRVFAKYGCRVKNIFDTRIAARVSGLDGDSFSSLLFGIRGISLDKNLQTTDWTRRPLRAEQIKYLARDVIFLPEVSEHLSEKVSKLGRNQWLREETLRELDFTLPANFDMDITPLLEKKNYKELNPSSKILFRTLWHYRNQIAEMLDTPPFYIFSDEFLFAFASGRTRPGQQEALKGVHRILKNERYDEFISFFSEQRMKEYQAMAIEEKQRTPANGENGRRERLSLSFVKSRLAPVVQHLQEKFGENTAKLLINGRDMKRIAGSGNMAHLPEYAVREITIAAEEAGVSLGIFSEADN